MNLRTRFLGLTCSPALLGIAPGAPAPRPTQPNILFIMSDEHYPHIREVIEAHWDD